MMQATVRVPDFTKILGCQNGEINRYRGEMCFFLQWTFNQSGAGESSANIRNNKLSRCNNTFDGLRMKAIVSAPFLRSCDLGEALPLWEIKMSTFWALDGKQIEPSSFWDLHSRKQQNELTFHGKRKRQSFRFFSDAKLSKLSEV